MSRAKEAQVHKDLNKDKTHFKDQIFAVDIVSNEEWLERVQNAQGEDPAISFASEQLMEKHEIQQGQFKRQRDIHLQKGTLMRGKQIVLPIALRYEVVETHHKQLGHLRAARTVSAVAENYTWSGNHISCHKSAVGNTTTLILLNYCRSVFQIFRISGYERPTCDHNKSVILDAWVHCHGRPSIAVSDQARNIDGEIINELCEQLGIKKHRSSPYHPEGDSQAERSVQTVKALIIRYISAEESVPKYAWHSILQQVALFIIHL